jgi:hypothetical protein
MIKKADSARRTCRIRALGMGFELSGGFNGVEAKSEGSHNVRRTFGRVALDKRQA